MQRQRTWQVLLPLLVALLPVGGWAQGARDAADPGLRQKTDVGGPSEELAGDISREEKDAEQKAAEERPALGFDTFRFTVELQLKDKRADLMRTLEQMASLVEDEKEKADLLFRLGELHWEEAQYWGFESHRQDDRVGACQAKGDRACVQAAQRDQAAYATRSKEHQHAAVARYEELIRTYPTYERMDEVLFFLGHNLWESGKQEEALGAYKSLITRFPDSRFVPDAYISFGEWYFNTSEGKRDRLELALEAYTRAASFTEARVYGYAIYKQGWCLYNLADYPAAADRFKATVFYGEVATNVGGDNKMALVREARKDYVLAYSHFGDPTQARAAFQQVGGDEHWRSMLEGLGGLYYDDGKDKEAVLVYRELIRDQPLSPKAPFFQSRIVDSVMRVGNKRLTVEQARILVQIFLEVKAADVIQTEADERALARAEELSERTLSSLAVNWHNEAKKTRDDETYAFASQMYSDYLAIFPASPKAYSLRFFHAELLFDPLEQFERSAQTYGLVVREDLGRIENGEEPQPWFVPALEGAIHAYDQVLAKLDDEPLPEGADPKEALPIPPAKQAFLEAAGHYLTHVPAGDMRVEVAYKAARIHYRYNHFDEAVEAFSSIALEHPEHPLAVFSAHLVLDAFHLLEDWEAIDEWAKRFYREPRLAKGEFRKELLEIIEKNSFQLIARLEQEERFAEAGDRYVRFVEDWPGSQLAGEALFNASVDYYRAGRVEQALAVRDRLVREYPGHTLAPQALLLNASVYEEIGDYAQASSLYEAYADGWATHRGKGYEEEKAKGALHDAGVFREALGDLDAALANRRTYLERWPRDEAAETVFLSIADLLTKKGSYNLALRHLDEYERQYGRVASKMIVGEHKIAQVYALRGSHTASRRIYERLLKYYGELSRQRREGLTPEALEGVGEAMMVDNLPHFQWFQRIQLALPERVMAQRLEAKANALLEVERRYVQVVALGAPRPAVCALTQIGKAYYEFAQALTDAPVPASLSEEHQMLYRDALLEQAMPVEQKGQEALAAAVAKSREVSLESSCSHEALSTLEARAPHLFPALAGEPAELEAARFASANGPLLQVQKVPARQQDAPPSTAVEETIPGLKARQVAQPPRAQEPRAPRSPTAPEPEPLLEGEPDDDDLLL